MPHLRRFLFTAAALSVMAAASAVPARADTILVVGNANGPLATAIVDCTFNAQTSTLTFTITNISPFDARITAVGFDIGPGNVDGFFGITLAQPNLGHFFSDFDLGTVPQFNTAVLDFGFTTGSDPGALFSSGRPSLGLAPGQSASFLVSGEAFSGLTEEEICEAIFVRFQSVGPDGQLSDVGRASAPTPLAMPEPMTMVLFGTGLAGVAVKVRRRRTAGRE